MVIYQKNTCLRFTNELHQCQSVNVTSLVSVVGCRLELTLLLLSCSPRFESVNLFKFFHNLNGFCDVV